MFMYFENRGRGCHPGMRHGMRGGWGHHGRHWGGAAANAAKAVRGACSTAASFGSCCSS